MEFTKFHISISKEFQFSDVCGENYTGQIDYIQFSPDNKNFAYIENVLTGHWASNYDILQTDWGNYTPESYCCATGDMEYHPKIWDFDLSPNGDFVVWNEDHFENGSNYREKWIWHSDSQPKLLLNSTWSGSPGEENQTGMWADISHDGKYIFIHHGFQYQPFKNTVIDALTGMVVDEFKCQNQALMHRSNTIVCVKSGLVELRSIGSNTSEYLMDTGLNEVINLEVSPSDNQLMLRENRGNNVMIINLNTGDSKVYESPIKDGFDEPVIAGSTFFHTDELILVYVEY